MTYKELYDKALWDLEHNRITLGEFEDMIEPLNKEIPKEEQTDRDLISRQAVIDLLNRLIEVERKQGTDVMNYGRERVNAYESILDEIESDYLFPSMPSAEKTAEWIPVKDRMPDFNDIVLASTVSDYDELRVILTVYKAEEFWFNGKIKAWMPLPEPYKAE